MASRHDGPANRWSKWPRQRAGFSPSRKPLALAASKTFSIGPRTREAVSAFAVQIGLPARIGGDGVHGLGAQWSSVGLQCRFPLGLVLLISESGGKRLPHVIGHLAKGGDAAVPLP